MIGNKLTGSPSIPYLLLDRMFKGTCDMPRRHAQQNPRTDGQCERGALYRTRDKRHRTINILPSPSFSIVSK
jgi:hypothetical protein